MVPNVLSLQGVFFFQNLRPVVTPLQDDVLANHANSETKIQRIKIRSIPNIKQSQVMPV